MAANIRQSAAAGPRAKVRWAVVCLLALAAPAWAAAAPKRSAPTDYEVKAAYLYNFGKFVKWPEEMARSGFVICVSGDDEFAGTLESVVRAQAIDGTPVSVKRIYAAGQIAGCRIVYLGRYAEIGMNAALAAARKASALTVSDMPGFAQRGGMIQFVMEEDRRVRFEVNLPAAEQAGLVLSSDLLKVARQVRRERGSGA